MIANFRNLPLIHTGVPFFSLCHLFVSYDISDKYCYDFFTAGTHQVSSIQASGDQIVGLRCSDRCFLGVSCYSISMHCKGAIVFPLKNIRTACGQG